MVNIRGTLVLLITLLPFPVYTCIVHLETHVTDTSNTVILVHEDNNPASSIVHQTALVQSLQLLHGKRPVKVYVQDSHGYSKTSSVVSNHTAVSDDLINNLAEHGIQAINIENNLGKNLLLTSSFTTQEYSARIDATIKTIQSNCTALVDTNRLKKHILSKLTTLNVHLNEPQLKQLASYAKKNRSFEQGEHEITTPTTADYTSYAAFMATQHELKELFALSHIATMSSSTLTFVIASTDLCSAISHTLQQAAGYKHVESIQAARGCLSKEAVQSYIHKFTGLEHTKAGEHKTYAIAIKSSQLVSTQPQRHWCSIKSVALLTCLGITAIASYFVARAV